MNDWLIDTNILIYFINPASPFYGEALRAINELNRRGAALWITAQNIAEFYATLTRSQRQGGLGLACADALREVAFIKQYFGLLEDSPATLPAWEALIAQTRVTGTDCFDIRLAAIMQVYGITNLLTKNVADFAAVPGIIVETPANL